MFLFFTKVRNLFNPLFLLLFFLPFFIFSQDTSPLKTKKESINKEFDWFVGASFSPLYTGMNKGIWDMVPYLAWIQREGSERGQTSSFATGVYGGVGWAFYNKDKKRISFGGEYGLSYYRTSSYFVFGNLDGSAQAPKVGFIGGNLVTWMPEYFPAPGSQQHLLMEGLEHKIGPYLKFSFVGPSFPIDLQLGVGLSFNHLISMKLQSYDGNYYKVTALNPKKLIMITTEGPPSNVVNEGTILRPNYILKPGPRSFDLALGFEETFQLAVYAGFKLYLANLFFGFDFTSNVLYSSYRIEVGFDFRNVFFADAWKV